MDEVNKCESCNLGYYLPSNLNDKSRCTPCDILHCLKCEGTLEEKICTECEYGYKLQDQQCIKACVLGWDSFCKTCNYEKESICGSCYEGYYLPENDNEKTSCKYCGSYLIKKCHEENNQIIVDECFYNDYTVLRNKCVPKCKNIYQNKYSYCKTCNNDPEKIDECKECIQGYYLPINENNQYCYPCPNECKSCKATFSNVVCSECLDNYILYEGRCIKNCNAKSYGNYCKTCNTEPGKNDRCLTCNIGYYLPDYTYDYIYNNKKCTKCPDLCTECELSDISRKVNCTKCAVGSFLSKINEKENKNLYTCFECTIPGCNKCERDISLNQNVCTECEEGATPYKFESKNISCYSTCSIGENELCKSCEKNSNECGECNEDYVKYNNKCVLDYHIEAKYKTTIENENVQLINYQIIEKMKIDGQNVINPSNDYTFSKPGEHIVLIKFTSDIDFQHLFTDITKITSIIFLDISFDIYIYYMNDCFKGCINLEYVDMSNLDLRNNRCFMNFFKGDKKLKEVKFPSITFSNIYWYYRMFYECESLTSIDMSRIDNYSGQYFYEMFFGCINLKVIKLNKFNKRYNGYEKYRMFVNVPKDADISIHKNFYEVVEDQLEGFTQTHEIQD